MTSPKAIASSKTAYSFGDFGSINGQLGQPGKAPKKSSAKAGPAHGPVKPTSTSVENNERSRAGIIKMRSFLLTSRQRGHALAGGHKVTPWSPGVGSAFLRGAYTPKGLKPLRTAGTESAGAKGEVKPTGPARAAGSASRPAGKPASTKQVHIPKLTKDIFPREVPEGPMAPLSMGLTWGLGKFNFDSGYFTDTDSLR